MEIDTALPPLKPRPQSGLGARLVGAEEEALVMEVLRNKRLFRYSYDLPPSEQGPMTSTLEREMREMIGVPYALAVTSGTAALEVALGALGIGPGDEVIVPSWSWISCFTSVVRLGARPVLAEIDETFCICPSEISRLTTPRTKAVMTVHYQGVAADMDPILAEARKAGIRVIEDCAESIGASYKGRRVGSMGDIAIFSFQAQKTVTSGEGGMVVTRDPTLYERAVRMHDIGLYRPHHHAFAQPSVGDFCGSQFRMNELTAAVALAQLRKVDTIRNHCRSLSARIMAVIGDLPGLDFRRIPDPQGDSGFEIYFSLASGELARAFSQALNKHNVDSVKKTGTYCHYAKPYCINRATFAPGASPFAEFKEWPAPGYRAEDFPATESLISRFVSLPVGVLYTEEDADYIARTVLALHSKLVCQ